MCDRDLGFKYKAPKSKETLNLHPNGLTFMFQVTKLSFPFYSHSFQRYTSLPSNRNTNFIF